MASAWRWRACRKSRAPMRRTSCSIASRKRHRFARPSSYRTDMNILLTALLTLVSPLATQPGSVVGTWKLVSYETQTADGARTFPLGQDVSGIAIYSADGHVSIQFMRRDRPRFASGDAW